ncbi:MAG: leucine-rich repeat domain-containing protein [Candidatus Hodarchaeota archaeon]
MTVFRDYQGVRLVASEATVLEELEEHLDHPIPNVMEFDRDEDEVEEQDYWFHFIVENDHVVELALEIQGLSSLPASIVTLGNLRRLILACNDLQSLPDKLGQLQSLKHLDLSQNQLRMLPDSIGQLTNLQSLDLSTNQLAFLPNSIGQLQSLRRLLLQNNQLASLPDTIGLLQNLKELYLSRNQLQSLPDSIGQLQSLQELDLNHNQLDTSLTNLKPLLWAATRNKIFKEHIPSQLFSHPIVHPLAPYSLDYQSNSLCPFCGTMGLVTGRVKKTGEDRSFCPECENIIP